MSLMAEAEMAGQIVRCPGCNIKLQIPATLPSSESAAPGSPGAATQGTGRFDAKAKAPQRQAWKEEDPTNPNARISFGIGLGVTLLWFAIVFPFQPPADKAVADYSGMQFLANLFYKHFTVSFANTLFFCWAMAICFLKLKKLKHQREALLLDVLPTELGKEINAQNVGSFVDHVYHLPVGLRDSLMVNRIRKALEFFEVRQNVSDVSAMMNSQSAIDGSRISGSYIILRAFLWAIPLLGFIGTVVGLSHAIGGMSFANVEDVSKIVGSINAVTSGLGTAFDATLLGLVLAVILNFPLNSLAKREDEMLNDIDAFCNEVLLPRLNDGAGAGGGDIGAIGDSVVKAIAGAQREFLTDLNELSARLMDSANSLEHRNQEHQAIVTQEFVTNMTAMRAEMETAMREAMTQTSQTIAGVEAGVKGMEAGLRGLNTVLQDLGEKQVVIQQVKKKGWFSRG
jgi:biopolymer transport protein ExbB/TolQ